VGKFFFYFLKISFFFFKKSNKKNKTKKKMLFLRIRKACLGLGRNVEIADEIYWIDGFIFSFTDGEEISTIELETLERKKESDEQKNILQNNSLESNVTRNRRASIGITMDRNSTSSVRISPNQFPIRNEKMMFRQNSFNFSGNNEKILFRQTSFLNTKTDQKILLRQNSIKYLSPNIEGTGFYSEDFFINEHIMQIKIKTNEDIDSIFQNIHKSVKEFVGEWISTSLSNQISYTLVRKSISVEQDQTLPLTNNNGFKTFKEKEFFEFLCPNCNSTVKYIKFKTKFCDICGPNEIVIENEFGLLKMIAQGGFGKVKKKKKKFNF
jgi:hypothetical protein